MSLPANYNRGNNNTTRERGKIMVQQTFTDMEYANRKRTTRREAFLEAMESIIPWNEWMALIAPYYVQSVAEN